MPTIRKYPLTDNIDLLTDTAAIFIEEKERDNHKKEGKPKPGKVTGNLFGDHHAV